MGQTQIHLSGWAVVLLCGAHRNVLSGSVTVTTGNAMELTGVVTDSQYGAHGVNEWLPGVDRDSLTPFRRSRPLPGT
jgi:ribonuclease HI